METKRLKNVLAGAIAALLISGLPISAATTGFDITGSVLEEGSEAPIPGAALKIDDGTIWAMSNAEGVYIFTDIPKGHYLLTVECLGYVAKSVEIELEDRDIKLDFSLKISSLAIEEVTVTAERAKTGLNTTTTLGRDALNHLQMSSLSDVSALLPGGKTINPDLTTATSFSLRQGGSTAGNAAFGTAVEVDGVRLESNAGFGALAGVDTRSISVDNVESVEVITGVPSAEYGDLGSGMVRIHTRHGKTPLNVNFSVNPRTWQTSVSKGLGLGDEGVLNVSGEWARATKKLYSPYESYTRRGLSLSYSNNFARHLRFEGGLSANIGGMNTEDDPDAFSGAFTKARANALRANSSISWMLGKPWITSLKAEASLSFEDELSQVHKYNSFSSNQPAVHSEQQGYSLAAKLPMLYYSDLITDSKELDLAASLKYSLNRNFGAVKSKFKAGAQWKANGNAGQGEYYLDPELAENGYRPRPYSEYPFMHNISLYAEEEALVPIGRSKLSLSFGLRQENVLVKGSSYRNVSSLSPRFNAKLELSDNFSVRGGWGISEKLPSFYILYPKQEYRDIQTFGYSYEGSSEYVYYTIPYTLEYNPELRWQRSSNSELGLDFRLGQTSVSLVGYINITENPYTLGTAYSPFSYRISARPGGFTTGALTDIRVDNQTGEVYVRGSEDEGWTLMDTKVIDRTFVKSTRQENGKPVRRAGVELTADFPEIRPLRTKFRLDASWCGTSTHDDRLCWYYQTGWSHSSEPDKSYQYAGLYANGGSTTPVVNGKITHNLDANLTAITHIPEARLIITLRLEASLLRMSRNISIADGQPYAQRSEDGYWYVYPVSYMDVDGNIHPFTQAQASDPAFSNLILKSGNIYTFDQDGYGPYACANLSITKEVGDKVSISFFANNFTYSRPYVVSWATGVGAIFTPDFYYGLSCRLKL